MKQKRAQKDSTRPFERVPIYQLARDVLRESHVIAARMSQGYKYSLGNALREAAMGATEAVFLAYEERLQPELKLHHVLEVKRLAHQLLVNLRIAYDLQQVTRSAYADQVDRVAQMFRQSEGWAHQVRHEAGHGDGQITATNGNCGAPESRTQAPAR